MNYENIPSNPVMLLSFMNTKMRDEHMNLDELCYDLELDRSEIEEKLGAIGYSYNADLKRFI
jgi:hypothetical protein